MTNHPNRGWRGRWTVTGDEARHGPSGLVVHFHRVEGAWDGEATNGQDVYIALRAAGTQNIDRMLARLMREAGDIFSERQDHE